MGRKENKNFTFEVSTRMMNSSSRQFMRFRFGRNLSEKYSCFISLQEIYL